MSGSIAESRSERRIEQRDDDRRGSDLWATGDDGAEPDWCVERGSLLCAMTTSELVAGLASGEIGRETRVWREGLECWTRSDLVPALSCAFSDVGPEIPNGMGVTPFVAEVSVSVVGSGAVGSGSIDGLMGISRGGSARAGVVGGAGTDVVVGGSINVDVAGPRDRRAPVNGAGALWVGAGGAVAAMAIGFALLRIQPSSAADSACAPLVGELSAVHSVVREAASALLRARDRAITSLSEPGQRRRRSGPAFAHNR